MSLNVSSTTRTKGNVPSHFKCFMALKTSLPIYPVTFL